MSTKAIKVENLGKLYRLGEVGTGTLSHDLNRWWARMRGQEDPFAKIGETNDRTQKGSSDYVWSLKDINFEVQQGEALGIIGRNGAGKSTLLKLLSKVTAPTTGRIKVNGRIASLLEVGTGFHPELTGRENIFLNGAILGMTKAEIKSKFDEIVAFSGVERYIDTPVKRYSSGMYVRLAFAVAAHLESEVLIVDEVLAVGDTEFQKKCLGKMGDVTKNEGRTVLFVSHSIGAIKTLCNSGIMLKNGNLLYSGSISETIQYYIDSTIDKTIKEEVLKSKCNRFELKTPYLINSLGQRTTIFSFQEEIILNFDLFFHQKVKSINPGFALLNNTGERIFTSHLKDDNEFRNDNELLGEVTFKSKLNLNSLAPGNYKIIYGIRDEFEKTVIYSEENVYFEINQTYAKNVGSGILWHTTKWEIK